MGQFITDDGARIAFDDEGEGRPLVLLHGLMAHRGFFEAQRALAERFRVIRVDLRGHGESPANSGAPSTQTLAEDVAALARKLDLHDAIGVGWSLGAAVLWHVLAGSASDRFAAAVVVDMTPRVMNEGDWELGLSRDHCDARSKAIRADFQSFASSAGAAIFAQRDGEARHPLADWAAAEFARNDAGAIGALWASLVEQDYRPILAAIRQPTLVVHGARSHLYGADTAHSLIAALPNARGIEFDRSGHAPHIEQPELFNRTLSEFAASLPPVRQTQTA